MRFRYNLNTLSSMYTYMLRNQIPFEKFMDSETEKVLAKLLLNNPEFSKYEETLRSMVMTKEEFETYQVMAANETLAQEQVKELLSVQELMKNMYAIWYIIPINSWKIAGSFRTIKKDLGNNDQLFKDDEGALRRKQRKPSGRHVPYFHAGGRP